MKTVFFSVDNLVKGSCFSTPEGVKEFYFTITSKEGISFCHELRMLCDTYIMAIGKYGL